MIFKRRKKLQNIAWIFDVTATLWWRAGLTRRLAGLQHPGYVLIDLSNCTRGTAATIGVFSPPVIVPEKHQQAVFPRKL